MNKTKLLSLILGIIMLMSVGCSTAPVTEPAESVENADSASGNVSSAITWLSDRLATFASDVTANGNEITHKDGNILLAVGNGAMGIDTTGLRNEGYIIRSEGDSTVIVASTEAGLDAGVRKYAAEYEQTGSTDVDAVDGLKVGKVILGGVDLKNYKILLPKAAEGDKSFQATATMVMGTAAGELQKYVRLATGYTLPIEYVVGLHQMTDAQVKEKCGNGIVFQLDPTAKGGSSIKGAVEAINGAFAETGPGDMGTESYHLTVTDGIMRLVGGNQRGCLYGTYDFLENYLGWRFMGDDVEYLYQADEIVIDDVDVSHTPTFGYRATTFPMAGDSNNFPKMKQNCFNTTMYAHMEYWGYGLGSTFYHAHSFSYQVEEGMKGSDPYGDQPCLTDPYTKEVIQNSMLSLIDERLNPPFNTRLGYDTVQIACSMNDNTNFCKCKDCMSVIRKTSFTDLYLGFVNDAAEVMEEYYPGIIVNTAIYFAARKPPVEVMPRENVSIYYCIQGCNQHTICDGLCAGYDTSLGTNNVEERAQLEAWTKICDRIYAWHYSVTFFSNLGPCPNVYEIYEDVTYVASLGVFGYYAEGSSSESNNFEALKAYLFCKLMYDADVTEEEFYDMIDEYITIVYGEESAPYIREYLDMHQASGDAIDGCFINNYHYPLDMMSYEYYRYNYEAMRDLFDSAIRYAKDSATERKIELLRLHMEFIGLSCTYEDNYVNGDAESRATYEARYKWLVDTYKAANLPTDRVNTAAPSDYDLSQNPALKFIPLLPILSKEGRA